MEKVFLVDKAKAMEIADNETIKRYGEVKYYDSSVFGIERKGTVVVVKGDKDLFKLEIFNGLEEITGDEKEKVLKKLREMEDSAAAGVGMIFG